MRKFLNVIFAILSALIVFVACEKEEKDVVKFSLPAGEEYIDRGLSYLFSKLGTPAMQEDGTVIYSDPNDKNVQYVSFMYDKNEVITLVMYQVLSVHSVSDIMAYLESMYIYVGVESLQHVYMSSDELRCCVFNELTKTIVIMSADILQ